MRYPTSLRILALCSACLAASLATAPAGAVDLTLRFQGQATSSDGDALGLGDDFGTSAGAYLGLEWRLTERLGIEAGAAWTELEQSATLDTFLLISRTTASLSVVPVTVALNIHLTPKSRYDLYLAPRIGWAFFDDLEIRSEFDFSGFPGFPGFAGPPLTLFDGFPTSQTTNLAVKDQFVYGLRLGFDVPFGKSAWSFSSSLEVLDLDLELEAVPRGAFSLDPISIGLGFAYRF